MILTNIKDCSKCKNSLVFGDNTIKCMTEDYISRENKYCATFCKEFIHSEDKKRAGRINQENALRFLLAGNSDFILHSTKTNEDFRYVLNIQNYKNNKDRYIYFVNMNNTYCGIIWFNKDKKEFVYTQGNKGNLHGSSIEIRSLLFVLNKLYNNETVNHLEVYNIGKCGCCGKELETIEEIIIGINSDCISKVNKHMLKI